MSSNKDPDQEILDDSQIKEQYCAMKYLGFTFFTLLLVLSAETRAQDNPFKVTQGSGSVMVVPTQAPCPDYKIGIITPPKDVDFKMRVITPSKNLDPGIIFKLVRILEPVVMGSAISQAEFRNTVP